MDIRDIREIMGLSQAQVADELGVPKQEVIDCEENGETYLLLQYISAFPINPQIMKNPDEDPFLPSFDQTTPGHRMAQWREKNGLSARDVADALGMSEEVQMSAGGIRLDTLYVDEGFGTLDGDVLQKAMNALNSLTEGNRLIGIISHVDELRRNIDRQIVVTKEKTGGSSVRIQ